MNKKYKYFLILFSIFLLSFIFILPNKLFIEPISTVVLDRNAYLLGAKIADDEQWRFPETRKVSDKLATCFIQFEDKRFRYHWGVDPIALCRALYLDVKYHKIVSGGSTITMQVVRLMRKGKPRTIYEKIIEIIIATRVEFSYSKDQILALYASYAPMGGNIVGIDAAAWKYFTTSANNLSWAQAASLAILPNAPSIIHPGRNRKNYRKKRNKLLKKLLNKQIISKEDFELAVDEELPAKPHTLPQKSKQLISFIDKKQIKGLKTVTKTAIDSHLQSLINNILRQKSAFLFSNKIYNAGVLVAEVETGNVVAYVGNIPNSPSSASNQVDMIQAQRSTGSVLKPFLYASAIQSGDILPQSLLPDIPIQFGGFMPKNYNKNYAGAVHASKALARSLNIPAVLLLRKYGLNKFYHRLKRIGINSLNFPAEHYGLSLILGGSEASLWQLCGAYASMARVLNNFAPNNGRYFAEDIHALSIKPKLYIAQKHELPNPILTASSIYYTFKAMLDVERPEGESAWRSFSSSQYISWKTGTSFGFRDAWAIGVTPKYVVGVWVGNADGEGRPELIGVRTAAPILFNVFDLLPKAQEWFELPADELIPVVTCHQSGFLAGQYCTDTDTLLLPASSEYGTTCPYHHMVHLSADEKFRVNSSCESPDKMVHKSFFTLPPTMEYYYKKTHPEYHTLPPFKTGCKTATNQGNIQMIYPKRNSKVYIPIGWNGKPSRVIFRAAHRLENAVLFWYIDDKLVETTRENHEVALFLKPGKYKLSLIDNYGETYILPFEVAKKE